MKIYSNFFLTSLFWHLKPCSFNNLHRVQICTQEQIYTQVQICTPLCRVHMAINCVHTHIDLIRNLTQGTHFYKKFAVFECSK